MDVKENNDEFLDHISTLSACAPSPCISLSVCFSLYVVMPAWHFVNNQKLKAEEQQLVGEKCVDVRTFVCSLIQEYAVTV